MDTYFLIVSFVMGAIFGSFYNVCIYRIPEKQSIVSPPSHCYNCNTRLKYIDLVPIISWIFLKGKCRYCEAKVSSRYAIVEFLTAILFSLIYISFGYEIKTLYYMFLVSLLIIITFIDIDHYIIPDNLILIGSIVAIIVNLLGYGVPLIDGLKGALFAGGGVLVVTLTLEYIVKKEVMGGGDVKLYAMIGLFLGTKLALLTIVISIYIGALYGIIFIIYNKVKKQGFSSTIPFGPFISIAAVISIFYGNQIIQFYLKTFL
ncbi:MAG: prepilin peptidase [Peptostreptococcaceae bacterium]